MDEPTHCISCCNVGLGLESFLIMPVQRIASYTLLLGQLAKMTDKSREDYSVVALALDKVRGPYCVCLD